MPEFYHKGGVDETVSEFGLGEPECQVFLPGREDGLALVLGAMNRPMGPIPNRAVEFVVLSFEGPDLYSLVGGLGVRVTEMTRTLAKMGIPTRLVFIGAPGSPDTEVYYEGNLTLHRWSGWLSQKYPDGVYSGEMEKIKDFHDSLPPFLVEKIVAPNSGAGITTVIVAEDWQTAPCLIRVGELLEKSGLLGDTLLMWNANNTFGFEGIPWPKLVKYAQLLTVSRYMKEKMRLLGLDPLVIQNGIPDRYWAEVDQTTGGRLRELFPGLLLTKVGRYHPDKRWRMAMAAVADAKAHGLCPTLIVRGGREDFGQVVRKTAADLGLVWRSVCPASLSPNDILTALECVGEADVLELDFFVPESFLRTLYWASRAVLANSGHEPFGLVGLEVMACGGVPITGSTGEEYLLSFFNGIALGSDDPREITVYLDELSKDQELESSIRRSAQATSKLFAWEIVLRDLLRKIEFVAKVRGVTLRDRVN